MSRLHVPTNGPPDSPGEILVDQYLKPLGITQSDFAKRIGVSVAGAIAKIKPVTYVEVA